MNRFPTKSGDRAKSVFPAGSLFEANARMENSRSNFDIKLGQDRLEIGQVVEFKRSKIDDPFACRQYSITAVLGGWGVVLLWGGGVLGWCCGVLRCGVWKVRVGFGGMVEG